MKINYKNINLFAIKLLLGITTILFVFSPKDSFSACAIGNVTATAASNVTCNSFTANWNAPGSGTPADYYIDLSTDNFASSVTGYPKYIGSTNLFYAISLLSPNTTYYYRVKAYCSTAGGGLSAAWSNIITVTTSALSSTCNCGVSGSTNTYGHISNVTLNSINRNSTFDGYINTGISTTLTMGTGYSLTGTMSNSSTTGRWIAAWIDFNGNGIFGDVSNEEILTPTLSTTSGTVAYNASFTVPNGTFEGTTKMRVVWKYQGGTQAAPTPCDTYNTYIDWEDYNITIIGSPSITTQPSNQTICSNSSADFSVSCVGLSPFTYQWKYNGSNVANGTPSGAVYSNSTSSILTVSGSIAAGTYSPYTCVISNSIGTTTSSSAQLSISASAAPSEPTGTTASPLYICSGSKSVLSATVGAGETLQWYTGSCSGTLLSTNSVYPTSTTTYYAKSYNSSTGCYSSCTSVSVGIMDPPSVITHPSGTYGCNGTAVTFSIVSTGAGLNYQWQENSGSWANLSNSGVYSGVTTETLTISNPAGLNGRQYRCVITGQCSPSATSNSATLNVLGSGLSGTKNVGSGGDYTTLKAAFDAINANGLIGNLELRVISDITETAEASLSQWNSCGNSGFTVTIYPTGATRTISGNIATSLVTLSGADYVTFNGKIDKTGAANSLVLSNTSTSGSAIKFISDATYNNILYCTLKGVSTTYTTGVIWFSTATSTGNDYNTISYCDVRDGATTPTLGIYSIGTSGKENDNNSISYCNIYNHHNTTAGGSTVGLYLENYNSKWTISNNSFYQTANRSQNSYRAINIAGSSGDDYYISNNYVGGQSPQCGGSALTYTNGGYTVLWYGIQVDVSTTGRSTISGNTVKNISWTSVPSSTGTVRFAGVAALGRVEVINNKVGDTTSTGSIAIVYNDNGTEFGALVGVYKLGNGDVLNNAIGSISVSGTHGDGSELYAIYVTGSLTTDILVSGNTIGSSLTANSIQIAAAATPVIPFLGISFGTSGSFTSTVSNNIIANVSNNCTASTTFTFGVSNIATGGIQRVIGNKIFKLSSAGTSTFTNTYPVLAGIKNNNTTTGNFTISGNNIHSLSVTGSTAVNLHGILLNNAAVGTNTVSCNSIHSFSSTSTTAEQNGIFLYSGTANISNNMIRLGIDKDGNSITTSALIRGIYKYAASSTSVFYNTVFIGGTAVASGTVSTACFERFQTATDVLKNNIFFNGRSNASGTGKHYAVKINATTTLTSDYNDLFINGTGGCISNAAAGCTFANWQALGSFDPSGQNVDPSLTNTTGNSTAVNLHLSSDASPVIDKGCYIAGYLTDYDNQTRKVGPTPPNNDGNDPCIGADERIIPPSAKNSYGIYMPEAQATGTIVECEIYATGGTPGGSGILVANPNNTNWANSSISTYPKISEQNIQCTYSNIDFTTNSGSANWLMGNGSNPPTSSLSTLPDVQYSTTGRKDILENVKIFKDFLNITMNPPSAGSILGAPAGAGCPTTYSYSSSVAGSAGFTYSWSATAPGGCTATIASQTSSTTDITFINTTGYNQVFILKLDISTECCGPLTQVIRYITIWPGPLSPSVSGTTFGVCTGGSQSLSVSSPDASYAYGWYDSASGGTLLGNGITYTANPIASGVTNYYVQATNSFGCTSSRVQMVITGNDTPAPTIPATSSCGNDNVTVSVSSPGAGYTYDWYSESCGGTILQSGISPSITSYITETTTYYVSASPSGCSTSSCTKTIITYITPTDPIVWLGNTGEASNWFNASNWTGGCIPTCATNVSIPFPTANSPDIGYSASGVAHCANLNLQTSSTLSFSDSRAVLEICGNFTHAGIVSTTALGQISFTGSSAQSYLNTGTGDLNSVLIDNSTGVTISSGDMNIGNSGILTLSSGLLNTGTNKVFVKNNSTSSINGHGTQSYINGNLKRNVNSTGSYDFPVGTSSYYEYSNINLNSSTGLTDFTAFFSTTGLGTVNTTMYINNVTETINSLLDYGFWTITPNAGMSAINYDITITERGHTNGGNPTTVHTIVKRTTAGPGPWNAYGWDLCSCHENSTQSGTGTNPVTAKLSNMTSFSDFAIGKKTSMPWALPTELISFQTICENNFIKCLWSTASEINNNYFILEHSYDGLMWERIATIKGAGNSNEIIPYTFYDKQSNTGVNYYKLLQQDVDGKIKEIGKSTSTCNNSPITIIIFPNPASSVLNVILNNYFEDKGIITIYDQIGKKIMSIPVTTSTDFSKIEIDLKGLSPGNYYLHCTLNSDILPVQRFVVSELDCQ